MLQPATVYCLTLLPDESRGWVAECLRTRSGSNQNPTATYHKQTLRWLPTVLSIIAFLSTLVLRWRNGECAFSQASVRAPKPIRERLRGDPELLS